MLNIRVAVRIRPFSEREISRYDETIVRKEGSSILVTNPNVLGNRKRTRRFLVDFCYEPNNPETCSQEAVYKEIGLEVLESMFSGYNACVLAYGHSASGKTYTMMGLPDDPGLTPRICQGLFNKVGTKPKIQFHVAVSFLEIYNEKVRDLLVKDDGSGTDNFSLRVREHPKLGPYVQDLSHHLVADKSRLMELLEFGNKRRRTAATENNVYSSRSHAVFTLWFKQTDDENYDIDKSSKVHLVDLAGSERASGAPNKTRLKEGANINKSLVTLGNVISALAENYETATAAKEHSSLKTWQPFVPYRDSVLTWLLKDTLGGNSNTIMIATVSPASSCHNETVNTLRYAKRTKRIINQPIINEDPKVRTIRELREEILRLKAMLMEYSTKTVNDFPLSLDNTNFMDVKSTDETVMEWLEPTRLPEKVKETNNGELKNSYRRTPNTSKEILERPDDVRTPVCRNLDELDEQFSERGGGYKKSPGNKSAFLHMLLGTRLPTPSYNDSCKINDVKESGVNESDIDSLQEAAVFSDSLESFTSPPLKIQQPLQVENNDSEHIIMSDDSISDGRKESSTSAVESQDPDRMLRKLNREMGLRENIAKSNGSKLVYKSRPDLIKGISTHSKDGLVSSASLSYTDVSNLSRSNSLNSWNSQGSLDASPPEIKPLHEVNNQAEKITRKIEFEPFVRKKDKRFEIVEAVTSRLYMTKKKSDSAENLSKREELNGNRELEELKLCKRARMKLCDSNRKLMMTKKIKKMIDIDTQTDFDNRTVRMKEKSIITDQRGPLMVEDCGTNTSSEDNLKENWNTPSAENSIHPTSLSKSEHSTIQIYGGNPLFQEVSHFGLPVKYVICDDEYFSEDSLDRGEPSKKSSYDRIYCTRNNYDASAKLIAKPVVNYNFHSFGTTNDSQGKELNYITEPPKIVQKQIQVTLVNDLESNFNVSTSDPESRAKKKEDTFSSENSLVSNESTDTGTISDTSSEDFVFYERAKEEPSRNATIIGNRELYTITENSEHSDPGDAFSSKDSTSPSSLQEVSKQRLSSTSLNVCNGNDTDLLPNCASVEDTGRISFQQQNTSLELKETKRFSEQANVGHENGTDGLRPVIQLPVLVSNDLNYEIPRTFRQVPPAKRLPSSSELSRQVFFPSSSDSGKKVRDMTELSANTKPIHLDAMNKITTENSMSRSFSGSGRINCFNQKQNGPQTHFVNFKVVNSSEGYQFSSLQFDTHLFKEDKKKDQSTETMFGSEDSITFVFMGPAKPKTSVLMEVIKRSLNKRSAKKAGKSRSAGVQCDSKLMRSLSVDTALMTLSRISKQLAKEVPRTTSLDNLRAEEMLLILEQGKQDDKRENSCQCDLGNDVKFHIREMPIRYSVSTSTSRDQETETASHSENGPESELKSPSRVNVNNGTGGTRQNEMIIFEKAKRIDCREFPNNRCNFRISKSRYLRRRLCFSKLDNNFHAISRRKQAGKLNKKCGRSTETISKFLKEAIILLRNLNFFKYPTYDDTGNQHNWADYPRERNKPSQTNKELLQLEDATLLDHGVVTSRTTGLKPSVTTTVNDPSKSMTWPRRTSSSGKPPIGMNSKYPKSTSSPTSSFSFLHQNAATDVLKIRNRPIHFSRDLTFRGLPGNFHRESQIRSSKGISCFSRRLSPSRRFTDKSSSPDINFTSISYLETELEESCRRLKLATEQDEIRQEMQEGRLEQQKEKLCRQRLTSRICDICSDNEEDFSYLKATETSRKGQLKERRTDISCVRKCSCGTKGNCASPRSKGFRSTFELNTFGPGSNHCHQFCIFCHKKDMELYCSTPSLNSDCFAGRCRLNYYGHCPCSGVKLRHVITSPRAYMQHLLTLRRRIVGAT
ncbi:hypothetical protein RUM44_000353 [Polyplax serrata]|uniref:Kinesin motor domain-containing protein n=1 Tax=Polyplax serrata TaxID=468196 RepID=A0ABR1B590_POLSC